MQILVVFLSSFMVVMNVQASPNHVRSEENNWIYVNEGKISVEFDNIFLPNLYEGSCLSLERRDIVGVANQLSLLKPNIILFDYVVMKEEVENYPEARISQLLLESPRLVEIFSTSSPPPKINFEDEETEGTPLCSSKREMDHSLRLLKNVDNIERIIVNQKELTQNVYVTRCMNNGTICSISEHLQVSNSCQEEFSRIRLLIFDLSNDKLELDNFDIPCGCVCGLNKTQDTFS